jgi:hypothetical protein
VPNYLRYRYHFLSDAGVASSSLTERASANQGGTAVAEAGTESVPVTLRILVYARPLTPSLAPEESAWLEQQLRTQQSP